MKKQPLLLLAALLASSFAQAKDYTLFIKGKGQIVKGNTEVFVNDGEQSDTITVTPGSDVTTITITVSAPDGTLLQQEVLSASGDRLDFTTPSTENGYLLSIRDNHGEVYCVID